MAKKLGLTNLLKRVGNVYVSYDEKSGKGAGIKFHFDTLGFERWGWVWLLGDWAGFEQLFPAMGIAVVGRHMYAVYTRWAVVMHAVCDGDGGPRIAILIMQHEVMCSGVVPQMDPTSEGYPNVDFRFPFFCGNADVMRDITTIDGKPLKYKDGGAYDATRTERPAAREAFEHALRMDPAAFTVTRAQQCFADLWRQSASLDWRQGLIGILTDPMHLTLLSDSKPVSPSTTSAQQTERTQEALRVIDRLVTERGGAVREVTRCLWSDEETAEWMRKLGCRADVASEQTRCSIC